MKVLKEGQKCWSKKVTCTGKGNGGNGCGSVLQITQHDIYKTDHTFIDGTTDYYQTFCCLNCGSETDIDVSVELLGKRPTERERRKYRKNFLKKNKIVGQKILTDITQ